MNWNFLASFAFYFFFAWFVAGFQFSAIAAAQSTTSGTLVCF